VLRRGFTVVEASLVLGLLLLIAAASVTLVRTSPEVGADLGARASLTAALDAVTEIDLDGGNSADPTRLDELTADLTFSAAPSSGPLEVSVAAEDGRLVLAASNGTGTCWLVLRDSVPAAGQPVVFHAFEAAAASCQATTYLNLDVVGFASGSSWRDPAEVA
jgi:hypothetical protein